MFHLPINKREQIGFSNVIGIIIENLHQLIRFLQCIIYWHEDFLRPIGDRIVKIKF